MIRRIAITISPARRGLDWSAFGDLINDTYQYDLYDTSSEEDSDDGLTYVFYGHDPADIVQYFEEQLHEDGAYPGRMAVAITDVAADQWKKLKRKHDFSLDWSPE